MNILWLVVPVALALVVTAVIAYVKSARAGQFDDLETPAIRILFDDEETTLGPMKIERLPRSRETAK